MWEGAGGKEDRGREKGSKQSKVYLHGAQEALIKGHEGRADSEYYWLEA